MPEQITAGDVLYEATDRTVENELLILRGYVEMLRASVSNLIVRVQELEARGVREDLGQADDATAARVDVLLAARKEAAS
jgi:hypothetical protein